MKNDWKKTIFSDGSSNFLSNVNPKLEDYIKISVRIDKKANLNEIFLVVWPKGEVFYHLLSKEREDDYFSWYSTEYRMRDLTLRYRFFLIVDGKGYYYSPYGLHKYEPSEYFSFVIYANADYSSWTPESIFYQIFPDRFYRSGETQLDSRPFTIKTKDEEYKFDRILSKWDDPIIKNMFQNRVVQFYGGNFKGIKEKIPYLKELGITAIYFNPIFLARSNHRYDVEDYEKPDTLLGSETELLELLNECKDNGIRTIFDAVLNHTGVNHRWFDLLDENNGEGAYNNPNSKYRDYYYFKGNSSEYESWMDSKILPQLNLKNSDVKKKLLLDKNSVIKKWLSPPFSIDGWRMDTASILGKFPVDQVDDEFSKELHTAIKETNVDVYIMGETFYDPKQIIDRDKYEAAMNYRGFASPVKKWLTGKIHFMTVPKGKEFHKINFSAKKMSRQMDIVRNSIPFQNQIRMFNLLNSHDTPRFLTETGSDIRKVKIAATMLFTYVGIPSIYYGDEIGMEGENDPDCRRPMIWDENRQNKEINALYRSLIKLRKDNDVLIYGSYMELYCKNNVFAFARFLDKKYIIVVCSRSENIEKVSIPTYKLGIENPFLTGYFNKLEVKGVNYEIQAALLPYECEVYISG
ncbi:MAG TPA: alpha-amylase family glycosyl hydrolase [Spirochaetota bacterium]|mgnify:FL=1|nr:alpha-amylase family glycosyl hydrolase [Spirochaetota bacterium]